MIIFCGILKVLWFVCKQSCLHCPLSFRMITLWPQIRYMYRCVGLLRSWWMKFMETCWWLTKRNRATSGRTNTQNNKDYHKTTKKHKGSQKISFTFDISSDLIIHLHTVCAAVQVTGCDHLGAVWTGEPAVQTLFWQTSADLRCEGAAAETAQATAQRTTGWALVRYFHSYLHIFGNLRQEKMRCQG